MRWLTASLIGLMLVGSPLVAQEPGQEREQEHVVRRGDTLWDLAGRYLANPFRWPLIHQANTRIVADPHWIYPEQVLVIPGLVADAGVRPPAEPGFGLQPVAPPMRTVFYREVRPAGQVGRPTVLMEPQRERVPVRLGEFLRAEYLDVPSQVPALGRVVRSLRHLDHRGALTPTAHPSDELYAAYVGQPAVQEGERLMVVAVGRRVREAGRDVRIIDPRAVVTVLAVEPELMRVRVEEQFGRVDPDHLLVRPGMYPDFIVEAAVPVAEGWDLAGQILSFVEDRPMHAPLHRAFIDRGRAEGVQVGDVFRAYLPERTVRTAGLAAFGRPADRLPEEGVAELRVVHVGEATATVVVDELWVPQLEEGLAIRRVRKMP
jgi:hypothetical protein